MMFSILKYRFIMGRPLHILNSVHGRMMPLGWEEVLTLSKYRKTYNKQTYDWHNLQMQCQKKRYNHHHRSNNHHHHRSNNHHCPQKIENKEQFWLTTRKKA